MSVEDRKKERLKKAFDVVLKSNPIIGYASKISELIKGKLTKEKEFSIEQLIKDLKKEQKEAAVKSATDKKGKVTKKTNPTLITKYQKLRSSKDKKFQGHTGRGD